MQYVKESLLKSTFTIFVVQVKKRTLHWSNMDQTLDVLTIQIKCGRNARVDKCDSGSTGAQGVTSTFARQDGCTLWWVASVEHCVNIMRNFSCSKGEQILCVIAQIYSCKHVIRQQWFEGNYLNIFPLIGFGMLNTFSCPVSEFLAILYRRK